MDGRARGRLASGVSRRRVLAAAPAGALVLGSGLWSPEAIAEGALPGTRRPAPGAYAVRDPVAWPFAPDSFWNTPLATSADMRSTDAFTRFIGRPGDPLGDVSVERVFIAPEENNIALALGPAPDPSTVLDVDPDDLAAARAGHPDSPAVGRYAVWGNGNGIGAGWPTNAPGWEADSRSAPRAPIHSTTEVVDMSRRSGAKRGHQIGVTPATPQGVGFLTSVVLDIPGVGRRRYADPGFDTIRDDYARVDLRNGVVYTDRPAFPADAVQVAVTYASTARVYRRMFGAMLDPERPRTEHAPAPALRTGSLEDGVQTVVTPPDYAHVGLPLARGWIKSNRFGFETPDGMEDELSASHRGVSLTARDLLYQTQGNGCTAIICAHPISGETAVFQISGVERPAPDTPLWGSSSAGAGAPGVQPRPAVAMPPAQRRRGFMSIWLGRSSNELFRGASRLQRHIMYRNAVVRFAPGDVVTVMRGATATGALTVTAVAPSSERGAGFLAVTGSVAPWSDAATRTLRRGGMDVAQVDFGSGAFDPLPTELPRVRENHREPPLTTRRLRGAPLLDPSTIGNHGGSRTSILGGTIALDALCAPGDAIDTIRHVVGLNPWGGFLSLRKEVASWTTRNGAQPDVTETGDPRIQAPDYHSSDPGDGLAHDDLGSARDCNRRNAQSLSALGRVWPAASCDAYAGSPLGPATRHVGYIGVDPNVTMGSLLVLPSQAWVDANLTLAATRGITAFDPRTELATIPARRIAWALMHFGGVPNDTEPAFRVPELHSFKVCVEERCMPARTGKAKWRFVQTAMWERFGIRCKTGPRDEWNGVAVTPGAGSWKAPPSPADADYAGWHGLTGAPGDASEAWRRDICVIMRRLCVVVNNLPWSPGGGPPDAARVLDHVVPPAGLLGGFFTYGAAIQPFSSLTLYSDTGETLALQRRDVFGRPHVNHAVGADLDDGAAIWGNLDRGWYRVGMRRALSPPIWFELGARRFGVWSLT